MNRMLKNIVCVLSVVFCMLFFISCGESKSDSFSIKAESSYYYVDLTETIQLSIEEGYFLTEKSPSDVVFTIVENECSATIQKKDDSKWYFSASSTGLAVVEAKIGDIKATNTLSITSIISSNTVSKNLSNVLNIEGGVVFGQTYDIGLTNFDRSFYEISGADGILRLDEKGKLEICGIGQGKIDLNYKGVSIFNGRYTVYNSTLATKIKEDLISQEKINSKSDLVTNDLLDYVLTLDMKGELINDPYAIYGIKYFRNLKLLDLSSNSLSDASFISSLSNLETLILKDNEFTDLSSIVENENLRKLDMSNNKLTKITNLQYLYKIEYLDLSDNYITNISPLSSSYSLKSLFLNNNKILNFKDSLSGLEDLIELGIGNCDISFVDIVSLRYLPNIEYLDISGTKPKLRTLATTLTKLKTLKISNCCLNNLVGEDSLSYINNFGLLETLDISNNNLDLEKWNELIDHPYIEGENFPYLKELSIGGNAFTDFPDLSKFEALKVLDLSESYNLTDVSSIRSLSIETLVLDGCNSISNSDFASLIVENAYIKKISTIGAFNYLDRTNFDTLALAVSRGEISWRFLTDVWTTSTSINNYKRIVYFSMNEFLTQGATRSAPSSNNYTINEEGNSEIIISLINDLGSLSSTHYNFSVPKGIFRIQLYGSKYYSYDISFNVLERKESSLTFNLYNFKDIVSKNNGNLITTQLGAKVVINSCAGENLLRGGDGTVSRSSSNQDVPTFIYPGSAFDGYDISINSLAGSSIALEGGDGGKGPNNGEGGNGQAWAGMQGGDGATAIICHDCTLVSGTIYINGGKGGNGGNTYNNIFSSHKNGMGGNGGNGICYSGAFYNNSSALIQGGKGGTQGTGKYESNNGSEGSAVYKK